MINEPAPGTFDWYVEFYRTAPQSAAHARYCERVYGRNLCQHGYTTMLQMDDILARAHLSPRSHVLDVGCGTGLIAEYISDMTGAHIHGIDIISGAIDRAKARTAAKSNRLHFETGDINLFPLRPAAYDVILALDTLYFGEMEPLIKRLMAALKPGGRLLAFYNLILWHEDDDRSSLLPDRTPLAEVLKRLSLRYETWEYTQAEYERSRLSRQVALELKDDFEAENNLLLWKNRMAEADGNMRFCEEVRMSRFLYRIYAD